MVGGALYQKLTNENRARRVSGKRKAPLVDNPGGGTFVQTAPRSYAVRLRSKNAFGSRTRRVEETRADK